MVIKEKKSAKEKAALSLDPELVKGAFAGQHFRELFDVNAESGGIKDYVLGLL